MKVSYLRDSSGKRIDFRSLAEKELKHFTVPQGSCFDGAYLYMAFEQKENKEAKREHRVKIVKINFATKKIEKISKALKLGHANDMCFNNGVLYITHSGSKKLIHTVKSNSLAKGKDISISYPSKYKKYATGFNGIAKYEDGYVLRCMGGNYLMYFDDDFKFKEAVKYSDGFGSIKVDSQGITYRNGTVVRAFSRLQSKSKNYICKYGLNGKFKTTKSKLKMTGELESVFYVENKLYGTSYRKKGKKRMAYIFKIG